MPRGMADAAIGLSRRGVMAGHNIPYSFPA